MRDSADGPDSEPSNDVRGAPTQRRGSLIEARLVKLLGSGGDSRIDIDPITGRNRYGTTLLPASGEISFSSSTASNISQSGFTAAARKLSKLTPCSLEIPHASDDWFNELHTEIGATLGIADAQTVLTASGTDAEIIALGLATGATDRPLTNIFIAPDETGNGVPMAATGRHFQSSTALGIAVEPGTPIDGLGRSAVDVRSVSIRNSDGSPRAGHEIDRDTTNAVEFELGRGHDVLLHVLDCSKTGLQGVSRETARRLKRHGRCRVRIVVDACQLRCSLSQIGQDLADGMMVIVTGSKFVAGPPFCGALLIPRPLAEEFAKSAHFPSGIGAYSAMCDWSPGLRPAFGTRLPRRSNIGLALRWAAALEMSAPLTTLDEAQRRAILVEFRDHVLAMSAKVLRIRALCGGQLHPHATPSIVSLIVLGRDGEQADTHEAQRVQRDLRDPALGPICHVGQPVTLGGMTALRVAASASDILKVANGLAKGQSMARAFQPIASNLQVLFSKWAYVSGRERLA